MVTIRYYGELREKIDKATEATEAKNIQELLKWIKKQYGKEAYRAAKSSHITVNGYNAGMSGGFKMKLNPNDIVCFMPVCGGG